MNRLLRLSTLLICINSFAQSKQPKPASKPYLKLSPALVFVKDLDPAPYISAGIGGHIGRYAALGISGGYLKFESASKPVIPFGLDLTLTDFKVKKVQPVVTIQTHYPIYDNVEKITNRVGNSTTTISAESKGVFMFNIGGGLAMPITQKKKLLLTGSYGQLMMKGTVTTQTLVSGRVNKSESTNNISTEMVTVGLTFML